MIIPEGGGVDIERVYPSSQKGGVEIEMVYPSSPSFIPFNSDPQPHTNNVWDSTKIS